VVGVAICGRFGSSFDLVLAPTLRGTSDERELLADAAATTERFLGLGEVFWIDQRNRLGHPEPVGTRPDFRRRGLARSVLSHAMERMRAAGMDSVSLTYDADNLAARRLYESLGFVHCDQTFGYRRRVI
jgi:mycothiol synthase